MAHGHLATLNIPGVRLGLPPAEPVRRLPTGHPALDGLLAGGWPRGHVSEVAGETSSGRTAILYAALAAATRRGETVALVDMADALDPGSLARAGAVLERVLWIRPPSPRAALQCAELVLDAGGFALVALDGTGEPTGAAAPGRARDRHPMSMRTVPAEVWLRLARLARRAGVACLICGCHRVVGSTAAVAVRLRSRRAVWQGRLFGGIVTAVRVERNRFGAAEGSVALALGECGGASARSVAGRGAREMWASGVEREAERGGEAAAARAGTG